MAELELPLSGGKMAAMLAISLVDRAYCLGGISDDRRQALLQELRSVQATLDRAEGRLIEGSLCFDAVLFGDMSRRIWQFRHDVEEIEAAVDDINYRRLGEEVSTPVSKFVKRKLINKVARLDVRWSNLRRLRKAVGSLQILLLHPYGNQEIDEFSFSRGLSYLNNVPSYAEPIGYPSWLATAKGIAVLEREKEDLVQWLLKDTSQGNPLSICALVGPCGVGKSTVANTVREDRRVLAHFDFIVWITEETIDQFELTGFPDSSILPKTIIVILETVTGEPYSDPSQLEQLRDKKLLLILDNVQSRGHHCETLLPPLKICKKGSKIFLTTRFQRIVIAAGRAIGAPAHVVLLERQLPSRVSSEDYPKSVPSNVPFSSPKHNERYPTWISNGGIIGRVREREQLVQWLTMDMAEDNPFSVYAVVGMAGMGKTTLANIVCHDPRVLANFKAIVWVPVSVDFETDSIARIILESITGRPVAYSSRNLLQNSLTETLRYRKVLLILDDVWEDISVDKWETLIAPLRVCKKGSRILVTTRMRSVVDMAAVAVGAQVKYLKIDELNENDNFMLFKSRLPSQVDSQDYDNLLLMGEQIVKKIGGCPLVTSLVASWLASHMDTHHWHAVLRKGWQHIDAKCIVLSSFRLSYDCLPTELQTCFRYCSLFPKGYKFNKEELAKMWLGSGLLHLSSSKLENIGLQKAKYVDLLNAEAVGEEHLDTLARKSFFCCMLETELSVEAQQEYYVLHDLMHDLAVHVSKGECARVDRGELHSISNTTRHLSIASCRNLGAICRHLLKIHRNSSFGFNCLRTLIIQTESGIDQDTELVLGVLLKNSRSLRLLYLGVPSLFHVLDSVHSLIHLRYLFMFSCDESHLQKVFKLYHLQVFRLEYLTSDGANCTGIHSLRCLRCLHVPDNMTSMIRHFGRLTLLQELHGFEVVKNDGQRLRALGKLRNLCQLSLRNLQNVLNFEEAVGIKLQKKQHLKLLSLSWNKNLTAPVDQDGGIIDNLEPNKEIQLVHIHGYSGVKLPVWIENSSLIHLVSLELEYCMKWKSLPSLKELTSLKHLKLENLFYLEYIGTVLEQQFETNESENAWLPPFLSTLTVRWCPNLKELPDIPCTLELLIMKHVQLEVLPGILQRYACGGDSAPDKSLLDFLHIESCPQLTSLNKGLLEKQEQLHSLRTLVLRHCERLHHLPKRGFAELHHLNSLEIVACPILRDVKAEDRLLPVSLRNLVVNPCGGINVSALMSLQILTNLRRLTLLNCSNVEELPAVEVFGIVNNLNDVSIARCKNLLSLGGLGVVASLRILSILCCDKLSSSYSTHDICTFKLQKLTIDRQALLSVEPLRSVIHISELHISDDYAMESLPGEWLLQNFRSLHSIEIGIAESLRSLPSEIKKLESLQSLHIKSAPLLQSLPQLPASLSKLKIWGCDPEFMKCYEREVGSDWGKIAHIADVDIQAYSECNNYADDQSQDIVNRTSNHYQQFIVIN